MLLDYEHRHHFQAKQSKMLKQISCCNTTTQNSTLSYARCNVTCKSDHNVMMPICSLVSTSIDSYDCGNKTKEKDIVQLNKYIQFCRVKFMKTVYEWN